MADTTCIDPWLKIREQTEIRNDLHDVAETYNKMSRLARIQHNRLKDRPKTKPETLEGLASIIAFCDERATPLFERLATLDSQIRDATERLNHE